MAIAAVRGYDEAVSQSLTTRYTAALDHGLALLAPTLETLGTVADTSSAVDTISKSQFYKHVEKQAAFFESLKANVMFSTKEVESAATAKNQRRLEFIASMKTVVGTVVSVDVTEHPNDKDVDKISEAVLVCRNLFKDNADIFVGATSDDWQGSPLHKKMVTVRRGLHSVLTRRFSLFMQKCCTKQTRHIAKALSCIVPSSMVACAQTRLGPKAAT